MKANKSYLFFLLFISFASFAQEETIIKSDDALPEIKRQYYVFSPRLSITVPHPISNRAFRKTFVGIYELSGGLNMMLFKGVFVGITYKNALLKITENKIPDFEANMNINNTGIKVGAEAFVSENNRIIFSGAITAGKNWTTFSGFKCKILTSEPPIKGYSVNYIEPEVNLFFLVEQNFGIGATLSYSFFDKNFDPYELCLNEWTQYNKITPVSTQYLSFGFGFYYSFLKKK